MSKKDLSKWYLSFRGNRQAIEGQQSMRNDADQWRVRNPSLMRGKKEERTPVWEQPTPVCRAPQYIAEGKFMSFSDLEEYRRQRDKK